MRRAANVIRSVVCSQSGWISKTENGNERGKETKAYIKDDKYRPAIKFVADDVSLVKNGQPSNIVEPERGRRNSFVVVGRYVFSRFRPFGVMMSDVAASAEHVRASFYFLSFRHRQRVYHVFALCENESNFLTRHAALGS